MFHYHIHVRIGLFGLIILISINNVLALYQNKYSKNYKVNYLLTQFRYLSSSAYRCESNVNIFWITKKLLICEFFYVWYLQLSSVDTWHFSKSSWSLDRQVTWKSRWSPFALTLTLPGLMVIDVVKLEMHLYTNITWSENRWVTWLDGCGQLNLSHTLLKLVTIVLAKMEIKLSFLISRVIKWSMNHVTLWVRYPQPKISKVIVRAAELNNKKIYMYYKLGQVCVTNWRSIVLLQIRANIVTNWGKCCYKLGQPLQIRATVITK